MAVDDRLPNELDMAGQYGVSRDVTRRAKEQLADQGWLIVLPDAARSSPTQD